MGSVPPLLPIRWERGLCCPSRIRLPSRQPPLQQNPARLSVVPAMGGEEAGGQQVRDPGAALSGMAMRGRRWATAAPAGGLSAFPAGLSQKVALATLFWRGSTTLPDVEELPDTVHCTTRLLVSDRTLPLANLDFSGVFWWTSSHISKNLDSA